MTLERLGGACLIVGGLVAMPLWIVFTYVHGPTSFNENNVTLGIDMHGWGLFLGVIPNVLVAAGLWIGRAAVLDGGGPAARAGFGVLLLALLLSAGLDLVWGALGPPIFLPGIAAGLVVLGLAPRGGRVAVSVLALRVALLGLGLLLAVAFAWALSPMDLFDRVGGYRIYGFMAHLLAGIGWVAIGFLVSRHEPGGRPPA